MASPLQISDTGVAESTSERMFLGLPIPERVAQLLAETFEQYPQYIEQQVAAQKWHIVLAWLGAVENPGQYYSRLSKPMPQSFVPTVQLTHVGRGKPQRQELWAFAEPTPVLIGIRNQVLARLKKMRFQFPTGEPRKDYTPHVTLAHLFPQVGHVGIADTPVVTSFSVSEVHLYSSQSRGEETTYSIEQTISLA